MSQQQLAALEARLSSSIAGLIEEQQASARGLPRDRPRIGIFAPGGRLREVFWPIYGGDRAPGRAAGGRLPVRAARSGVGGDLLYRLGTLHGALQGHSERTAHGPPGRANKGIFQPGLTFLSLQPARGRHQALMNFVLERDHEERKLSYGRAIGPAHRPRGCQRITSG